MNKAYRILILTVISVLMLFEVNPVFAVGNLGGQALIRNVDRMQAQASRAASVQQKELGNVINRANTLISNRLTSLNNLAQRVKNDSRLTASEKMSLSSDISTDVNGLTSLKTKIDTDTTVTVAREDEKQIISNYYIYAIFEPKIRLLLVLNNLETVTGNLQTLVPQIQNLITTLQSQGKNVNALQTLLNDVSSQLSASSTTLSSDISSVEQVSASSGTVSAHATFTKVKEDIFQIVRTGFVRIKSDFSQMRPIFRTVISTNSTTTSPSTNSAVTQ